MWVAVLQVAVTPARTSATMRSRASGADSSEEATTSATDTARVCSPTRIRKQEDSPNQPWAGLSSVQGWCAESTAWSPEWSWNSPKPRPTTASPTSLTGKAPGTGQGQRSRTSRSAPVNSSMVVRQSTRSIPSHKVRVWV